MPPAQNNSVGQALSNGAWLALLNQKVFSPHHYNTAAIECGAIPSHASGIQNNSLPG